MITIFVFLCRGEEVWVVATCVYVHECRTPYLCVYVDYGIFSPLQLCVTKVIFDWWVELMRGKVAWKCVIAMLGALSVTIHSMPTKLWLPVGNLDLMELVNTVLHATMKQDSFVLIWRHYKLSYFVTTDANCNC